MTESVNIRTGGTPKDAVTVCSCDMATTHVYVGLGDRDRALDWLERGIGREMYVAYLGIDPTFRPLHAEPRFRRLLSRVKLDA